MDIDNLSISIETQANAAVGQLQELEKALVSLSSVRTTGITTAAKNIDKLSASTSKLTSGAVDNLSRLADSLNKLTSVGRISPTFGTQIAKIGESLSRLDYNAASKLGNLAQGLSSLSKLEKAKLTTFINQLGKLPQVIKDLQKADLNLFTEQMERLAAALRPLSNQMSSIGSGFANMGRNVGRVTSSLSRGSGLSKMSGTLSFLTKNLSAVVVARGLKNVINSMNQYIEDVNLFTVALGEYAGEAQKYADIVSDVMGIDPGQWMRNQGVFQTLATGFGVVADRAYIMSKNLTQLGYDISSFFNLKVEDSMVKLQSGLAGELEPLRRLGWDLSVARLQQEALNLGISKSVSLMTQAEKAELRYYAIMKQVTVAQGDMARTLSAPANQLRIFSMQLTMAARAIGSIFIPMLNAILPYAIAAAQAIRMVASAIASLFGFKMPEIDYSGVQVAAAGAADLADSADAAAGGLGKAAKAAKELKNATLGIDELNVISPPEDNASGGSGGSGGGGAGGVDGFDFELPEYDFLGDAVAGRVQEIMDKLKPGIQWIQDHMDQIATLVEGIAVGLLAWKLAKSFLDSVGLLKEAFKTLAGLFTYGPMTEGVYNLSNALKAFGAAALFAVAGVAEVDLIKRMFEAFKDGEAINWPDMIKFTADYAAVLGSLWGAFKLLGMGNIGLIVGTLVGGIPLLAAAFDDMFQNGLTPQNVAMVGAFAVGVGAIAIAINPLAALVTGVTAVLGGLALALSQDAIPKVEIFDKTISDATKKAVEPFTNDIRTLQDDLRGMEFNPKLITPDTVNSIRTKVAGIRDTILNELDSDRNAELAKLEPLKASISPDKFQKIVDSVNGHYDNLIKNINADQGRIDQLLEQVGSDDAAIAQSAMSDIYDIITGWQAEGIKALSGTQTESERILTNLKNASNRITAEQASTAIQEATRTRNETIAAAKEQYSMIVEQANRLHEAGIINDEEYNEWIRLAEETREETIQAARDQYNGIIEVVDQKLGTDLVDKVDHHTGEINSRWEAFWVGRIKNQNDAFNEIQENLGKDYDETEDIEKTRQEQLSKIHDDWWVSLKERAGVGFDNVKETIGNLWTDWTENKAMPDLANFAAGVAIWAEGVKERIKDKYDSLILWWQQNVSPKLTTAYWVDKLSGISEGITAAFTNGINGAVRVLNRFITWFNDKLTFKVPSMELDDGSTVGGQTVSLGKIPTIPTFAQGGYPTTGQLFLANEAGPELVGQIGRQTAVANSSQIEDAITLGVSKANDRVAELLYELLKAVEAKDLNVVIGDDRIGRANDRYQLSRGVKVNTGAFANAY